MSTLLLKKGPCVENPEDEKWDVLQISQNTGMTRVRLRVGNEVKDKCVIQVGIPTYIIQYYSMK